MGEITKIVDKGKELADKGIGFVKGLSRKDLLLYGGIALGVIVLLVIIGVAIKSSRRRNAYRDNVRAYGRAEIRALRRAEKREDRYNRALIRQRCREKYYLPRKRRVLYVKTKSPKAKRQVKVQRVYASADQSTVMATGIVGMGIGAMAYSALMDEKRKFRL